MALGSNLQKKESIPKVQESIPKESESKSEISNKALKVVDDQGKVNRQFCIFHAGEEEYAIPIDVVKEVVKISEIAPVPQMPRYILGMANVRGNIHGVMDLECFFKGSESVKEQKYFLVLDHEVYKMAIVISEVPNSLIVSGEMMEELNASSLKSVVGQKFLKGIIKKEKRMIINIDILGMISSEIFTKVL